MDRPEAIEYPIVIKNLTKNFNGFKALDSLSLSVKRNEFLGFLGPNGAGKTTTIKILTNLISASDGQAYLNGVDVTVEPKKALTGVGSVVETPEFYPYLTPHESLRYIGRLRGMPYERIRERSDDVLSLVGLTEWKDQRIGKFSKGMKQRLALGQAILNEPHVLILDEPTGGLDPRGMVEIRNILRGLKEEEYTVFMSSHLLNEVQEVCDHVALIDRGKLIASGEVSKLLMNEGCRTIEARFFRKLEAKDEERISRLENVKRVQRMDEERLTISLKGGEKEQAALLREIDGMNVGLSSLREAGMDLETLYLSLIKESR